MNKPSHANRFMLAYLLYSGIILQVVILVVAAMGIVDFNSALGEKILLFSNHLLTFGIPIALFCIITRTRLGAVIPHERLSFKNIVLILLITLFTMPLISFASAITSFFAENTVGNEISDYMKKFSMGFMVLTVGVMPAIFEELMFRGIIMSGYRRTGLIKSIFFSALFFGVMHLNLFQLLYAIVAGLIFGILVHYTNSIFSSMLAHFAVNGSQVVLAMFLMNTSEYEAMLETAETATSNLEGVVASAVMLAFTLPVLIALLYLFIKINSGKQIDYKYSLCAKHEFETRLEKSPADDRICDFSMISIMIFYVLYMQLLEWVQKM